MEERLVRDRFVVGLRDSNLVDKLCRTQKLTLEEARLQARINEDAVKARAAVLQALGVIRFVDSVTDSTVTLKDSLFDGLGELQDEYVIRLQPGAKPFSLSVPRRVPIPLHKPVREELTKLESQGVIQRVDRPTPWCSGMVAVPKAEGGYRICVDLTRLNAVVLQERHILPEDCWEW